MFVHKRSANSLLAISSGKSHNNGLEKRSCEIGAELGGLVCRSLLQRRIEGTPVGRRFTFKACCAKFLFFSFRFFGAREASVRPYSRRILISSYCDTGWYGDRGGFSLRLGENRRALVMIKLLGDCGPKPSSLFGIRFFVVTVLTYKKFRTLDGKSCQSAISPWVYYCQGDSLVETSVLPKEMTRCDFKNIRTMHQIKLFDRPYRREYGIRLIELLEIARSAISPWIDTIYYTTRATGSIIYVRIGVL